MDTRIQSLEAWKIAVNAVDQYKASENKSSTKWINNELVRILAIALGLIVTLVAMLKGGK